MSSTTPPDAAASNPALTTPCPGAAPGGVTMRFGQSPTTGEHAFSVEPEPPPPCVPAPAIGHSLRCVDCGGPMTEADRGTADEAGREAHAFGKCHPLPVSGPILSAAEIGRTVSEAAELATYYANLGPMPIDPGSRLAFARAVLHLSALLATPLSEELETFDALGQAATKRPWEAHCSSLSGDEIVTTEDRDILASFGANRVGQRDAAFVVAICNAWPRLRDGIRAQAATIREQAGEIARHKSKAAEAFREVAAGLDRERDLRASLALVRTDTSGVWRWQGDGGDHPESLSCPVVMSADTLRGFQAEIAALRALAGKSCPCEFVEPCSKMCSCARPFMSGGCSRCCKYGSVEQQTAAAERLATGGTP